MNFRVVRDWADQLGGSGCPYHEFGSAIDLGFREGPSTYVLR